MILKERAHGVSMYFMSSEFGKNPEVVSFDGNHLGVRRVDGSLVTSSVSPFFSVLHGYAASYQWDDALRLCRFIKVFKFTTLRVFHDLEKDVNFSQKI
jgi:hypothetical protein